MYGHKLSISFFDDTMCNMLDKLATGILEDHYKPNGLKLPTYDNTHYTNIMFYCDAIDKLPELQYVIDDCNADIFSRPTMGFVPPNKNVGIHIDGYGCECKILIPIWPVVDSHTLNFYDNVEKEAVFKLPTDRFNPVVFNCTKLHGGVITNDFWRTNLQFKFSNPFEEILDMIKNETLFKTIKIKILD